MKAETFENLSKRMGGTTSRRSLLKAFVAGVGAAIAGSLHSSGAPKAEAIGSAYPTVFLKGMCYESFPKPYNPSTANAAATSNCGIAGDGTGLQLFFASDACRRESAPMWGKSFTLQSGTTITGRDDVGTMKNMGVTLIRPYDWDGRNDHQQFLNYCQANGIKVLAALSNFYTDPTLGWSPNVADLVALIKSFGNSSTNPTDYHPAIVGIIVGNEPSFNHYDAAKCVLVTNLYTQAEAQTGFPTKPMIGHPVDFTFYNGNQLAPDWGFWDALLPQLSSISSRLFLAPQTYNPANYLYVNAGEPGTGGMGYVPATWNRYHLPILFTEIGKSRNEDPANYQTVVQGQLSASIAYAAANPGQVLGTAFFEFSDKVWKCPTAPGCTDTEGGFGAFSHTTNFPSSLNVPYVCNARSCDFIPYHYDYDGRITPTPMACGNQQVNFDTLAPGALVSIITAAYTTNGTCGTQGQVCCTTTPNCVSPLVCQNNMCVPPCGNQGQTCCTTNPACGAGLTCTNNTCVSTCGADGQMCCATSPACGAGLTCRNNVCEPAGDCGGQSQPCCTSGTPCGGGLTCQGGTCQPVQSCGTQVGAPCCTQGAACVTGLTCVSGTCQPSGNCGGYTQACCNGTTCNSTGLTCQGGVCQPNGSCGAPTQTCCSGPSACFIPNSVCVAGKCANCGFDGQPCCTGNTCAQPSITCSTADGMCHNCGLPNQPCCGGITGTCANGHTCRNGQCY